MAKEKTTGIADESQLDYSTAWIFDTHLVTHGCQDEALLDLPQSIESDTLYLVGDVIDFWRVRRARYWPQSHYNVIQKLLRSARKGTRVILTRGNHDDMPRGYVDHEFGRNDRTALVEHESGGLERCAGPKRPKLSNGRPR
jgi:UDP-2,3-diacylglucosamine pyrophosphatase LpxH